MDTKALRQKILDLAIRGKLVPQEPNDEPASVLLERIRAEKQQMVKDGKLKAKDIKNDTVIFVGEDNLHYEKFSDGSVKCIEEEIPFELPKGWEWIRLNTIASFSGGKTPSTSKSEFWGHDYLWITSKDMKSKYITESKLCLSKKGAETMQLLDVDTLLFVARSGILRHSFPVAIIKKPATINQDIKAITLYLPELSEFLYYYLKGIEKRILLKYSKSGTTVENINFDLFKNIPVPIPPTSEQHRIVLEINKVLSFTSSIENNKVDLQSLIQQTKSKILDLAIRGKLVPQDPNDEPASVLLERIKADKEGLIKQGKIKRDKKESVIFRGEDNSYYRISSYNKSCREQLYELPANWSICTLPDIAKIDLGKTLDTSKKTGKPHSYLRSVNVRWCNIDLSDLKEMLIEDEELERYSVQKNDLLICEGGDVGRSCVWTSNETICYQNALHRVRLYDNCNPFFFMYYMMHYESKGIIKDMCKGVTIKHLTGNVLSTIPFSLPPVSEQNRIVTAIETTFAQLDKIANAIV